jgi:N-methylhydantoinase A
MLGRNGTKRLGVDVGGTYTDLVLLDEATGQMAAAKAPSVPDDLARGVINGLEALGVDLSDLGMIVHGSTIGVNTVIQGNGATVGLLTTAGFEDVVEIGTMSRPEMYNLLYRKPTPLVSRDHRIGIQERVTARGAILQPVRVSEVIESVERLVAEGIVSVAIATLHSYANPSNEDAIAAAIRNRFPELALSVSHTIVNQRREFERTSTTVVNAYIAPRMAHYLDRLLGELNARGFAGSLMIMKSNGGVMTADAARATPVHTMLSGPVAGSIAGQILGASAASGDVITFDMGGTSCDISVIQNGVPGMAYEASVGGHPVMTPLVDISYLGAGGGSIARVVGNQSLRVGPESAGAAPGPACYGKGGNQATVTDAQLVLGRLDPDGALAGGIALNLELATDAIRKNVANPLGMSIEEAALGIVEIACVKMAYAIRAVTVEQGLDPRVFTLIAFGGAGPMHAPIIAQMVGIKRVIVPWSPGTVCAWGMLNTDLRHDVVKTVDYGGRHLGATKELSAIFKALEQEAGATLISQGVDQSQVVTLRSIDVRYSGQEHTLTISLPAGPISDRSIAALRQDFDHAHERRYAHASPQEPVEFVNIRVEAIGEMPKPGLMAPPNGPDGPRAEVGQRRVLFKEGALDTLIYQRDRLTCGSTISGPAVIVEDGATTVLPPGFALVVDAYRNLIVSVPQDVSQ